MTNQTTTIDLSFALMIATDYTEGYVQPGWLSGTIGDSRWLSWQGGDIELDGYFSVSDLRAIADHMEKFQ